MSFTSNYPGTKRIPRYLGILFEHFLVWATSFVLCWIDPSSIGQLWFLVQPILTPSAAAGCKAAQILSDTSCWPRNTHGGRRTRRPPGSPFRGWESSFPRRSQSTLSWKIRWINTSNLFIILQCWESASCFDTDPDPTPSFCCGSKSGSYFQFE